MASIHYVYYRGSSDTALRERKVKLERVCFRECHAVLPVRLVRMVSAVLSLVSVSMEGNVIT